MDRAILLDLNEEYLDRPPNSAYYEFADVDASSLPEGDHQLIGTLNGTPVYLADKCLDLSEIEVDGVNAYATGAMKLFDNQYSGTSWTGSVPGPLGEFQGFDASDLGQFVEANHERIQDENAEMTEHNCMVLSSAEPEVAPAPGESSPAMTMKI